MADPCWEVPFAVDAPTPTPSGGVPIVTTAPFTNPDWGLLLPVDVSVNTVVAPQGPLVEGGLVWVANGHALGQRALYVVLGIPDATTLQLYAVGNIVDDVGEPWFAVTGVEVPTGSSVEVVPLFLGLNSYDFRPDAAGTAPGSRFLTVDGPVEFVSTGTKWRTNLGGRVIDEIRAGEDWAQFGVDLAFEQGPGMITADGTPGTGVDNLNGLIFDKPVTPYSLTTHVKLWAAGDNTGAGLVIRDNATTKLKTFWVRATGAAATGFELAVQTWTNQTTFNGDVADETALGLIQPGGVWLRLSDDLVTLRYQASLDGITWFDVTSEPSGTFIVGDQIGIVAFNKGSMRAVWDGLEVV